MHNLDIWWFADELSWFRSVLMLPCIPSMVKRDQWRTKSSHSFSLFRLSWEVSYWSLIFDLLISFEVFNESSIPCELIFDLFQCLWSESTSSWFSSSSFSVNRLPSMHQSNIYFPPFPWFVQSINYWFSTLSELPEHESLNFSQYLWSASITDIPDSISPLTSCH